MSTSPLARVEMAPRDPILGITEAFAADTSPTKVNLGVGVYTGDDGKVPVLDCVRKAEVKLAETALPRGYLPIDGYPAYNKAVQELVFGKDHSALKDKRVATVQTLGGTGGLKVGADFLKRLLPDAQLWISDPSWENHRALFENAGFTVNTYPYYDAQTRGINFDGLIATFNKLSANSIVLLHACCHNPTGVDLTPAQWDKIIEVVNARGLIPFLDMAYQGFGENPDADAAAVRKFAEKTPAVFLSSSFSKSLSLYGERVGAFSLVAQSADETARALSQLKRVIRTNYSNPPTHGGRTVADVLTTPELRTLWDRELAAMRDRIKRMRRELVAKVKALSPALDFEFVNQQNGMFSYSGLTKAQVERLRTEFSIYAVDTGRICVAALNSKNIDYVAKAVAEVSKK